METFDISPDDCLVVHAVGRSKSLREAAALLNCDPASLVRKVQRIFTQHGLLLKIKGRWVPTEKGRRMAEWAEEGIHSQKVLLDERPRVRIATTMWMAEQVLIPNMEALSTESRRRYLWSIRTPKQEFEDDLISGFSDFAIVCHAPYDPAIGHKKVARENWIAVAPAAWGVETAKLPPRDLIKFLKERPFIRHAEINPDAILETGMADRISDFLVDNLISVRSAVEHGLGWSCVPEILVRSSLKRRTIVPLRLATRVSGDVCLWWLRTRPSSAQTVKTLAKWLATSC